MTRKESAALGGQSNAIKSHTKSLNEYLKNPKICEVCGNIIPYERRRWRTCSKECGDELRNTSSGYRNVPGYDEPQKCKYCGKECKNINSLKQHETRCKYNPNHITIIPHENSGKWDRNNWTPWNKGLTKDTDERIRKVTESNRIKYDKGLIKSSGRASTPELEELRRRRISETMKKSQNAGGKRIGSGRGKKGWYKGIFCDSSWELAFVIYHFDHNLNIKRCEEKRTYIWDGETHTYIPDFITDDGIIEIKGYKTEQWIEKYKQNPDIKVLYEDDMKQYLEYVISKYGKNYTKLYENNS